MVQGGLDPIFNPRSVAIIGASKDPVKWGNLMSKTLIESTYKGEVYFINIQGGKVYGRKTYRTLSDVGKPADLAIIGIPARFVPNAVKECVENGVKGILIISAGFGEMSEEGKRVEQQLVEMARKVGARIIGPNCLGIYNSYSGLNATIHPISKGPLALLTQSGNFATNLYYCATRRNLGFSKFVSFGNQIDITLDEYLYYIKDDSDTKAILLYLEGLRDGKRFMKVAKEVSKSKPLVAIKIGTSAAGIRSAASHTGALAGSNEVYDGAFKQVGIIRVDTSDELLDIGETMAKCPLPKGNRIAILSDGGGHATMAADATEKYGLSLPVLSAETQDNLAKVIPEGAIHSLKNPVDFASEADLWLFSMCTEVLLQCEEIDGVVIAGGFGGTVITFPAMVKIEEEIAPEIAKLVKKYNKPIIAHSMFYDYKPKALDILSRHGVPVYSAVEMAVKCMSSLAQYKRFLDNVAEEEKENAVILSPNRVSRVKEIIGEVKDAGRVNLVETEAREILKAYGLPMSDFELAKSRHEAVQIAGTLGCPIAMKIVSPDILHKSDAGGVKLNVENNVAKAFDEIMNNARAYKKEAELYGVLITPMAAKGVEVIIGMTNEHGFGPTIMFGLGGIFVEVLKDVSFRVAPLTKRDAYEMIKDIKGFPILKGVRGQKPADTTALADMIVKVSVLVTENPEIGELDLNPVFVFERGSSVVDARMTLK
jgi:acetyl coenzyme A synthetase (ADP forming)-like protein